MADPLSIIASTASIADICVRLASYLRNVQKATETIEDDIAALIHEVEALDAITISVQKSFKDDIFTNAGSEDPEKENHLWKHVRQTLSNCKSTTEGLETIVVELYGKTGPAVTGFRDAVIKSHRRKNKEGDLRNCRDQLATYQNVLQILLASINM